MRHVFVLLLICAAIGLGSCSRSGLYERFIAEDLRNDVQEVVTAIEHRDTDRLVQAFGPQAETEAFRARLEAFYPEMPPGDWVSEPSVAGAHRNWSQTMGQDERNTQSVVLTTETLDSSIRIDLIFYKTGDAPWYLQNMNVYEFEAHSGIFGLSVSDLSPGRSLALALALTSFGLITFTFIASFFFKKLKRRILWPLFILVGYPQFVFNWTTEAWTLTSPTLRVTENGFNLNVFNISIFGAGFVDNSPVEPALLSIGLPIGALLFWWRVSRGGPPRKAEPVPR